MTSLVVEEVSRRFGSVWALDSVSFAISGGVCLVVGPNGAGKSTFLRVYPSGLSRSNLPFGGEVARVRVGSSRDWRPSGTWTRRGRSGTRSIRRCACRYLGLHGLI